MLVRSAVTATIALGGALAGVALTVKSVLLAGSSDDGRAIPRPDGSAASPPQALAGAALLRGMGPIVTKSPALLSVSTHPFPLRTAAVVLSSVAVGAASKQLADDP